jgi:hypothetical protein
MNSHTGLEARIQDYEQQQQRKQDEEALRLSDANEDHSELDSLEVLAETEIDTDVDEDEESIELNEPRKEREKYNACNGISQLWIL